MRKRWYVLVCMLLIATMVVTTVIAATNFRFTATSASLHIVGSATGLQNTGILGVDVLMNATLRGTVLCGTPGNNNSAPGQGPINVFLSSVTNIPQSAITSNGRGDFAIHLSDADLLSTLPPGPASGCPNGNWVTQFIPDTMNLMLRAQRRDDGTVIGSQSYSCVADHSQTPVRFDCH